MDGNAEAPIPAPAAGQSRLFDHDNREHGAMMDSVTTHDLAGLAIMALTGWISPRIGFFFLFVLLGLEWAVRP